MNPLQSLAAAGLYTMFSLLFFGWLTVPAVAGFKGVSLQFPVGYSLKDFRYVADVMDAGHVDPKVLISSVVTLEQLPAAFEELRGDNDETKVQIAP